VDFHRIRLTFKGTSAVSNALVFAQKLYTIEDGKEQVLSYFIAKVLILRNPVF